MPTPLISIKGTDLPKNTHRAIVESVDFTKIIVVAAGNEQHCRSVMKRYLEQHDLSEIARAYIMELQYDYMVRSHTSERPVQIEGKDPFYVKVRRIEERQYR